MPPGCLDSPPRLSPRRPSERPLVDCADASSDSEEALVPPRTPLASLAGAIPLARRRNFGLAVVVSLACTAVVPAVWPRSRAPTASRLQIVGSNEVQAKSSQKEICGAVEEDTEYHTSESLFWVSNMASQELCCAECDANPECLAWTYGKPSAPEGAARHCFLKKLAKGERPKKFKRKGLVSGLVDQSAKEKKHGVVSEMMEEEQARDVDTILENETCPGDLEIPGYGNISVIAAMWRNPGDIGGLVKVPYKNWAVIPHLRGKAYFGDSCSVSSTGQYARKEYTAMKLLGNTLRYTVDVSKTGCGCNAQLHLAPLRFNERESKCRDYYCGHGFQHCGVSCTEIGIQDANQYAWSTNLHLHDDAAGPAAGYGGGSSSWSGRHLWNAEQYGPGGKCIDTTWPFDVEVHFPMVSTDLLKAVEVTLTQEGHDCPLTASLDSYHFKGRNGMVELTSILNKGVTPVIQYWGSPDLEWLDGAGKDGNGPCVREVPKTCPDSVRFYDFKVTKGAGGHEVKESDEGLLVSAINVVHQHQQQHKSEEVNSTIQELQAEKEAEKIDDLPNVIRDGITPVTEKEHNKTVPVHIQAVPTKGDYLEWEEQNEEWAVTCNVLHLRKSASLKGLAAGKKLRGEIVLGKKVGAWIKLQSGTFAPIHQDGQACLNKRVVAYEKIVKGNCEDAGMFPIMDLTVCAAAGYALGYFDQGVTIERTNHESPFGCYIAHGDLFLSLSKANKDNGVVKDMYPLCASSAYPTTTTTTTTLTSTTTTTTSSSSTITTTITTVTSTSTTTWGYPSLFCIEVVRMTGYEFPLCKNQQLFGASIFGCEEYQVYSSGGHPMVVGVDPGGRKIMTHVIPPIREAVGDLRHGATTNSWLNTKTFLQVWDLVHKDGRYWKHHWTVKVDPDAVFFPERLRTHMRPHTKDHAQLFVMNCARYNPVALYGSIEIFSKAALVKYMEGSWKCRKSLPWHGWGEDYFMSHCMDMLQVGRIYDFDLLSDKRCVYRPCWDTSRVSYHDYKDSSISGSWFRCWNESRRR